MKLMDRLSLATDLVIIGGVATMFAPVVGGAILVGAFYTVWSPLYELGKECEKNKDEEGK